MAIVTSISNVKNLGDKILCKYTALSGQVGVFSELGTTVAPLIPSASSATPNGSFYWIYVGKDCLGRKKFIADRNIQHSISWDALNSAGVCSEVNLNDIKTNLIPQMSSYTLNNITISASSEYSPVFAAWKAFDRIADASGSGNSWVTSNGVTNGWLKIDFSEPKRVTMYTIRSRVYNTQGIGVNPKSWTFEGSNDNTSWTILDTQINQTSWEFGGKREYSISNKDKFRYYRLKVSANNGGGYLCIDELELMDRFIISDQTNYYIRLLTGGTSATDTENEWDKIIVNSDLNGSITKGDNNTWNYLNMSSMTSSTSLDSNANRIARGYSSVSAYYSNAANSSFSTVGFRPVLLVEQLIVDKFLIKKDSKYYSIDSKYYDEPTHSFIPLTLDGGADPNRNDIDTFGFDNLLSFITLMTKGSDTFRPCDKLNNSQIKYYKKK